MLTTSFLQVLKNGFGRFNGTRFSSTLVTVSNGNIEGTRILTLNRPPVNSLTLEMLNSIAENMNKLSSDHEVHGVILKSGISPPWYMHETVVRLLGGRMAEKAFMLAYIFKGREALQAGFVDEVVDSVADLDARCDEVMKQWLTVPRLGRSASKLELRRGVVDYASKNRNAIEDSFVECMMSDSVQKAISDYFESRKKK